MRLLRILFEVFTIYPSDNILTCSCFFQSFFLPAQIRMDSTCPCRPIASSFDDSSITSHFPALPIPSISSRLFCGSYANSSINIVSPVPISQHFPFSFTCTRYRPAGAYRQLAQLAYRGCIKASKTGIQSPLFSWIFQWLHYSNAYCCSHGRSQCWILTVLGRSSFQFIIAFSNTMIARGGCSGTRWRTSIPHPSASNSISPS
jgi:hypothetical protein